jgi:transposase
VAVFAGEIAKRGHAVRLMNPRLVRPCVKSNKNDARDAAVYKVT